MSSLTSDFAATLDAVLGPAEQQPLAAEVQPPGAIYLPERDEVSRPAGIDINPGRCLREKTAPAMLNRLSKASIEGESGGLPAVVAMTRL